MFKARCSNNRKDNYVPEMTFVCRLTKGNDQYIYEFEHLDDMQGFKLVKASASNEVYEAEARKLAHAKMRVYYFGKVEQFLKEVEQGVWG